MFLFLTAGKPKSPGGGEKQAVNKAKAGGIKFNLMSSPGRDKRNELHLEVGENGLISVWFTDYKGERAAFTAPCFRLIKDDPDIAEMLGINAIVPRKGVDGETPMKQSETSDYTWQQLLILKNEEDCDAEGVAFVRNALLRWFNSRATKEHYQYPTKMKFGGNHTQNPVRKPDALLLDENVLGLMFSCYPDHTREQLAEMPEAVAEFFEDVQRGQDVLRGISETEVGIVATNPGTAIADTDDED